MEKTRRNDPSMKPIQKARTSTMFFCNFFSSLLLLLLAFCCRTTMPQPSISLSPSSSASPVLPALPPEEVEVINALLRLSRIPAPNIDWEFFPTDCSSPQFGKAIGCTCTLRVCRVTKIDLSDQMLTGKIPDEIGAFSQLTSLDLSRNRLFGSIPSSIVNLSQLLELNVGDNNLGGPLPLFINEMKSLQNLNLLNNWFSGSIPHEIGTLPSLEYLFLSNNLLSGSIPIELGNISSLTGLYLDHNILSRQLPPHLGNLSNLQHMYIMSNEFSGALPSCFGKLERMLHFNIRGNSISGTIPDFVAKWQSLQLLMLMGNNFEGPLPTNISALRRLTDFAINSLPGSPGGSLFPEISNASYLRRLILRNCSLTDKIPDYIWQLPALFYLDLSFNNFTGRIPEKEQPFPKYIFLRKNKLNGSLPSWLPNLNESYVDVSENQFTNKTVSTSTIPPNTNLFACCSNITNVNEKWQEADYYCNDETQRYDQLYINCGGKATSVGGNVYEADLNPYGESTLFLSNNKNWGYSSMGLSETADDKFIVTKELSIAAASLYMSARLTSISLKYYGFCLKNDLYIVRLHFAEISWNASKFSNQSKRVFDVAIQGRKVLQNFNIEAEAGGVGEPVTREFRVSLNNSRLEIHLYSIGKGSLSGPEKYYGPLISAISVHPAKMHGKLSRMAIAGIVVSVLLFLMLFLGFFWKYGWLRGRKTINKKLKGVELYPGGVFNFQKIKAANNNFARENKIGEGGFGAVYKGVLPNGNEIAVKQLSAKSKQGAREFVNEIGTIYSLQHPNLVRLIGCCTEENQLLLVYEYMENNSLDHALFGPGEVKSRLNWETRVKICLGIAKGLAFLHGESKLKIIHRDIKPTNILLDKDFNAKISDFGYALLNEEETTRVITKIAGTTGYMAPEYMQGFLTPKADVYSFGVVTLEVVSGKKVSTSRPADQTLYLLDIAYDYLQQGNLIALVDPSLGSNYDHNEALKILHLAMQCVSPAPKLRPTMSEVVKILQGKKKMKTTSVSFPPDNSSKDKPFLAFSESTQFQSASLTGASGASTSSLH